MTILPAATVELLAVPAWVSVRPTPATTVDAASSVNPTTFGTVTGTGGAGGGDVMVDAWPRAAGPLLSVKPT